MQLTRILTPVFLAACLAAAAACSSDDADAEDTQQASTAAEDAVVAEYVDAFNAEDVAAVMATMSPDMDRLSPDLVECEHEAVFEQADATLSVGPDADPETGARAYEVLDTSGEVKDSGAVTFVFAEDGLLNGTTLPAEIGADFGVDFSACKPVE